MSGALPGALEPDFVPNTAEAIAKDVLWARIAGVSVERLAVEGELARSIDTGDAGDGLAFEAHAAANVVGHDQRRPCGGAAAIAVASLPGLVAIKGVEREILGIHKDARHHSGGDV